MGQDRITSSCIHIHLTMLVAMDTAQSVQVTSVAFARPD